MTLYVKVSDKEAIKLVPASATAKRAEHNLMIILGLKKGKLKWAR